MLMENLELREQVFRKMGCVLENLYSDEFEYESYYIWRKPEWRGTDQWWKNLPPIETTWEVTAKYLVPFMRGNGWSWDKQNSFGMTGHKEWFIWRETKNPIRAEIINNDLARAACEAFMEVSID